MRLKLSVFTAVLLALAGFMNPSVSYAQTVSLVPSAVPNGVAAKSGQQYRQRVNITLGGTALNHNYNMFTITAPGELTIVENSATATTNSATRIVSKVSATTSAITVGMTNTASVGAQGQAVGNTGITVEFDLTTPASFAGVGSGAKIDTSYAIDFRTESSQSDRTVAVAKHNNRPIRLVSFAAPDSSVGDTTTAGGRYFKLQFAPSGLPDLSHTGLSGLSASSVPLSTDNSTDITYSFYLSTDSTLVKRSSSMVPAGFVTIEPTRTPLVGTRQKPRTVPNTYIREDYLTTFGTTGLDTLNGLMSLDGTVDNTVYYVYVLADPNVGRSTILTNASGRKRYDPTTQGALTAGTFLGRSGALLVQHPPEFIVVGWDYDDDSGDNFASTGEIQVSSDQIQMIAASTDKDNVNITVDSGGFVGRGVALSSLSTGSSLPRPTSTVDLLYVAQDADNPQNFRMNIFLSTSSGLGVNNLVGVGIDSLSGSIKVLKADTLGINQNIFTFDPIVRDSTTNLIKSFIAENDYFVYFAGTDGTYRTVSQVFNDPFLATKSAATLSVKHSPTMSIDTFSLNDFDGDGDLDVVTGIGVSQMQTDPDGRDLSLAPAQRYVNIFWGGTGGMDGDLDVDNNATIDFYFSTKSSYRAAGKSIAYTSGNSDGTDLLAGNSLSATPDDTHLIVSGIQEDPDGLYDNNYRWDLWTYVSPEGTIPRTGTNYYLYALMKGGSATRLVSLTETNVNTAGGTAQSIRFEHPPFIRAVEPSQDITVSVDESVLVTWEAFDIDNAEAHGTAAVPAGQSGRLAPNSRGDSPNIRILLTSSDFGEVTTWGTMTNSATVVPFWLANSGSGALDDEVELNEGVDTAFVFSANKMRRDLDLNGAAASVLGTNNGVGGTYYVYLAIDSGDDGTVAAQGTFGSRSPLVRAPGRITFTGNVPTNPATSNRFIIPKTFTVVGNERLKVPVTPDSLLGGQTIGNVSLFFSIDETLWNIVDTDPATAGVQPFTLGANSQLSGANVSQGVYLQNGKRRLDFIYNDQTTGLTFFDGKQPMVYLNLQAKAITGAGATISTDISLDNTEPRKSKMLVRSTNQDILASIPNAISVDIVRRSVVTGSVPLESRSSSADTVTFFLREVGDLNAVTDSLFNTNDTDPSRAGIQLVTTGVNGAFTLNYVPDGLWILRAQVKRFLAGHDTLNVLPGVDLSNVRPTLDGSGTDHAELQGGDVAGYTDSTGASVPDNVIDSQDTNAINAALFKQLGETGYNTFADINQDSVVNATDKNLSASNTTDNTGASGIVPVFPTFKQVVSVGSNAEAKVSLVGLPEGEIRIGETFDVTVRVDQAVGVRAYEVKLDYDAEKLAVDDLVSNGSLFEFYNADMAGKVIHDGQVGFANVIMGETPYGASGEGTLATIRFRSIARGGSASLKLFDAMLINVKNLEATPQLDAQNLIVTLSKAPAVYHDGDGNEIRGLILAESDAKVDFNDFVFLAQHFGSSIEVESFDMRADLNGDNLVNFADFLMLTQDFGKIAVDVPAVKRASKVSPNTMGINDQASLSLKVDGQAKMGENLVVEVDLAQASALIGWGLTVGFDAAQYEFVEAIAPEGNLLAGQDAPIFLVHSDSEGRVSLANAIAGAGAASGEGSLARLVFRPKGDIEEARFEIFEGVLFDPSRLANVPSSSLLNVRAVPSEFALAQNYPNPFNPETTITYDLAADSDVRLEIYNVMGQVVRTLVSDNQSAGRYRVSWLGDNSLGHQVASGVYFYRIQADGFHSVKKLMLLK